MANIIWTARAVKGLSGFFDVVSPPVTISVDGLKPAEVVSVRSASQSSDTPVPFRSGGNVQLDFNNTKIIVITKGRFCLELEEDPTDPLDAHWE